VQGEEIRPVINVIVRELAPLERFLADGAEETVGLGGRARVHRLPGPERTTANGEGTTAQQESEMDGAEVGSSMRAAAPPVQSFAMGRRR
jgi:hypothetical protein